MPVLTWRVIHTEINIRTRKSSFRTQNPNKIAASNVNKRASDGARACKVWEKQSACISFSSHFELLVPKLREEENASKPHSRCRLLRLATLGSPPPLPPYLLTPFFPTISQGKSSLVCRDSIHRAIRYYSECVFDIPTGFIRQLRDHGHSFGLCIYLVRPCFSSSFSFILCLGLFHHSFIHEWLVCAHSLHRQRRVSKARIWGPIEASQSASQFLYLIPE